MLGGVVMDAKTKLDCDNPTHMGGGKPTEKPRECKRGLSMQPARNAP